VSGLGGAPGGGLTGDANRPPVNQVMDSILGMALQLPALKSIGDSIGLDFSSAVNATAAPETPAAPKRNPK
jgi:hypothetical protein